MAHEKILVTEDEEKISRIVKSYLEKEGFEVSVASTGTMALETIQKGYDLVILDLMLPDMEGETVCTEIRRFSDVPIIILTAKGSEDERVRGLGLGADDYVVKPFSPRELVARVKAHLRRMMGKDGQVLSYNGGLLKINIPAMEVTRAGIPVDLTKTEFSILLYLAQRAQTVISRAQIISSVMGYEFEGYDRVTDAHIKNIRRKIEENPQEPVFIRTIYGAGYKFVGKTE
ncbi:MAG: DNA-binding response regulator [Deltaproteobacteria bacterium HGW-Deltaproteobacteria-15]|jgi:DNA-binding response OmpR family regulator|nr:MAG: DNA-binding response regulator [Deltaproteobacteria bacterium HGW-Deltaproteobacteria-15]